jgi:hypothetical protein
MEISLVKLVGTSYKKRKEVVIRSWTGIWESSQKNLGRSTCLITAMLSEFLFLRVLLSEFWPWGSPSFRIRVESLPCLLLLLLANSNCLLMVLNHYRTTNAYHAWTTAKLLGYWSRGFLRYLQITYDRRFVLF